MALEGTRRLASAIDPANTTAKNAQTTDAAAPKRDFSAEMKRIAARAESVETLKNGAKLYHLPNGRVIEQLPGHSPYVTQKGTPPPTTTKTPPPATTTTTPSTTTTTPPPATPPTTTTKTPPPATTSSK